MQNQKIKDTLVIAKFAYGESVEFWIRGKLIVSHAEEYLGYGAKSIIYRRKGGEWKTYRRADFPELVVRLAKA